ncbi:MAG: STAS domain-containing protein, partial [Candidatus Binatia bacterium]
MKSAVEGGLSFMQTGDAALEVKLAGAWRLRDGLPSASLLERELDGAPRIKSVAFDTKELESWDSSVLAFLVDISALCRQRGIQMDTAGLPSGLHRLLNLAEAVPEKKGARKE